MSGLQKFFTEVLSIYWWISVIVVGLLLSVAGNFAYKYSEIFIAKYSNKRREKSGGARSTLRTDNREY